MKPQFKPALVAILLVATAAAHAVVIGFDNLPGENLDPYSGHTEKGFNVSTDGPWRNNFFFGNPTNCISTLRTGSTQFINIAREDGGLFNCQSVDETTFELLTYLTFFGYRGGVQVTEWTEIVGSNGGWLTVKNEEQAQMDALVIKIRPTDVSEIIFVDNIVVTPVPEPASLIALTLGGIMLWHPRRRK